jgi:hypothetical protein
VQKARLGFYDQSNWEYRYFDIDKPLEITKLVGNVSLKDGSPIVHAHITLADADGNAFGGHLAPGTVVFACEFIIHEFYPQYEQFGEQAPTFERGYDEETGLPLWQM